VCRREAGDSSSPAESLRKASSISLTLPRIFSLPALCLCTTHPFFPLPLAKADIRQSLRRCPHNSRSVTAQIRSAQKSFMPESLGLGASLDSIPLLRPFFDSLAATTGNFLMFPFFCGGLNAALIYGVTSLRWRKRDSS